MLICFSENQIGNYLLCLNLAEMTLLEYVLFFKHFRYVWQCAYRSVIIESLFIRSFKNWLHNSTFQCRGKYPISQTDIYKVH